MACSIAVAASLGGCAGVTDRSPSPSGTSPTPTPTMSPVGTTAVASPASPPPATVTGASPSSTHGPVPVEAVFVVDGFFRDAIFGDVQLIAVAPDGYERVIARFEASTLQRAGKLLFNSDPQLGADGYLAYSVVGNITTQPLYWWFLDTRRPDAAPFEVGPSEAHLLAGPDSRWVLAPYGPWAPEAGSLSIITPAMETVSSIDIGEDVTPLAWLADGSGWYAGRAIDLASNGAPVIVPAISFGDPPKRGGILRPDGSFQVSPRPALYSATGRIPFGPVDGLGVGFLGRDDPDTMRVVTGEGGPDRTVTWYRYPKPPVGNPWGSLVWDAAGTGLWVVEPVDSTYRLIHLSAPGATPTVLATLDSANVGDESSWVEISGVAPDDAFVVVQIASGQKNGDVYDTYLVDAASGSALRIDSLLSDPETGDAGNELRIQLAGWASAGGP